MWVVGSDERGKRNGHKNTSIYQRPLMYLNNINKVVDTVCTFCLSLLFGLQYSDLNVAD